MCKCVTSCRHPRMLSSQNHRPPLWNTGQPMLHGHNPTEDRASLPLYGWDCQGATGGVPVLQHPRSSRTATASVQRPTSSSQPLAGFSSSCYTGRGGTRSHHGREQNNFSLKCSLSTSESLGTTPQHKCIPDLRVCLTRHRTSDSPTWSLGKSQYDSNCGSN